MDETRGEVIDGKDDSRKTKAKNKLIEKGRNTGSEVGRQEGCRKSVEEA